MTVADGVQLWVEERGDEGAPAVLLVMGAASSGLVWPEELVDRLARSHRVVRYDHRDTGRSTRGSSYALRDLATDAVAVLDGLGVDRAHVVGMSMGGLLTQLLLLDHPDRLRSATLFCTGPLGGAAGDPAPPPSEDLLAFWATMAEPRDDEAELAWRVEHWARLAGDQLDVDRAEWRELEQRVAAHSGGCCRRPRTPSPTRAAWPAAPSSPRSRCPCWWSRHRPTRPTRRRTRSAWPTRWATRGSSPCRGWATRSRPWWSPRSPRRSRPTWPGPSGAGGGAAGRRG